MNLATPRKTLPRHPTCDGFRLGMTSVAQGQKVAVRFDVEIRELDASAKLELRAAIVMMSRAADLDSDALKESGRRTK